jgi:Txe/YoeB family toxin of toxin-antitoxin system
MWRIEYTRRAAKDAEKLKASHLYKKAKHLLDVLRTNPWQSPPEYEKLFGDMQGAYSRRLNDQHRLVYSVDEPNRIVVILAMWSHYE